MAEPTSGALQNPLSWSRLLPATSHIDRPRKKRPTNKWRAIGEALCWSCCSWLSALTLNKIHRGGVPVELRQDHRYRLAAQVSFTCGGGKGDLREGTGLTRDISKSGIFILAPTPPPLDTAILLEVTLPLSEAPGTKLRSHGRVVRIEVEGFAVSADVAFRMLTEKHTRRRTSPEEEHADAASSDARAVSGSGPKSRYALHLQ